MLFIIKVIFSHFKISFQRIMTNKNKEKHTSNSVGSGIDCNESLRLLLLTIVSGGLSRKRILSSLISALELTEKRFKKSNKNTIYISKHQHINSIYFNS